MCLKRVRCLAIKPQKISYGILLILFCSIPSLTYAGRIDYSNISLENMKWIVWFTIGLLFLFACIGTIAWVRYLRSYEPHPGTFTPLQVLVIVSGFLVGVIVFALFQMGIL